MKIFYAAPGVFLFVCFLYLTPSFALLCGFGRLAGPGSRSALWWPMLLRACPLQPGPSPGCPEARNAHRAHSDPCAGHTVASGSPGGGWVSDVGPGRRKRAGRGTRAERGAGGGPGAQVARWAGAERAAGRPWKRQSHREPGRPGMCRGRPRHVGRGGSPQGKQTPVAPTPGAFRSKLQRLGPVLRVGPDPIITQAQAHL